MKGAMIMKKSYKLLVSFIFLFIFSLTSVNAKKMTVRELGTLIENDYHGYYAYIIGEYAFTSEHILKTQDIMLASRSINVTDISGQVASDAIYDEMTIYYIVQEYIDDAPVWKISTNLVGSSVLTEQTELDIRFIDYQPLSEPTNFSVILNKEDYDSFISDDLKFSGGNKANSEDLVLENNNLSGLIFENKTVNETPGNYFSFIIEVPNATAKTTVNIEGTTTKTYSYNDFQIKDKALSGLAVVWQLDTTSSNKDIIIHVDLDGPETLYDEKTYTINWANVTFPVASLAQISLDIPYPDELALNEWGYILPTDDYQLIPGSNNEFALQGKIIEQHTNNGVFKAEGEDAYYFAYNIKLDDFKDDITITIPAGANSTKTIRKSDLNNLDYLTVLFKLNDKCQDEDSSKCTFDIVIDLDGDKKAYTPTTYTINYSSVLFELPSKFSIEQPNSEQLSALATKYGWEKGSDYQTSFKTTNHQTTVTGLIPYIPEISKNVDEFEHLKNHYLAFTIKLTDPVTDQTTVKFLADGEDAEKIITGKSTFNNNMMTVLKPLHSDDNNTFAIEIDIDGSASKYAPYNITIDWTSLVLQEQSFISDIKIATSDDLLTNEDLSKLNYNNDLNELSISPVNNQEYQYSLTGTIKQQTSIAMPSDLKTGYYLPLVLNIPLNLPDATIKLTNSNYGKNSYTLNSTDIINGQVVALFSIDKDSISRGENIVITIDLDGPTAHNYNEVSYKINYSTLKALDEIKITYDYGLNVDPETTIYYEGETIEKPANPSSKKLYHEFDNWYQENNLFSFENNKTATTDLNNITLKAHWIVDIDALLNDLVDYYALQDDQINITYNNQNHKLLYELLVSENINLSEFTSGIVPNLIAYLINSGEIKDITFKANNETIKFTSANNETIATELTSFIDKVISSEQANNKKYLDVLVASKYEITVEIGDLLSPVDKYKDLNSKTLTIDFAIADHDEVSNQSELEEALAKSSTSGKTHSIILTDSFEVNKTIELNKDLIIKGQNHTITFTDDVTDKALAVTNGNITIYSLTIASANNELAKAITVAANATLNINNVDVSATNITGIEVASGATLNATDLIDTKEDYDHPAVLANKPNAKVNIVNGAGPITYQERVAYEDIKDTQTSDLTKGDLLRDKENYNYNHYYVSANHSIGWYKITYIANRDITSSVIRFIRYHKATDTSNLKEPPIDMDYLTTYSNAYYDYKVKQWCNTNDSSCFNVGEIPAPKADSYYVAQLEGKMKATAQEVSNEEELIEAINNANIKTIIVNSEITLTDTLQINHDVTITGRKTGSKTIVGTIKGTMLLNSGNVILDNIKIIGQYTTETLLEKDKYIIKAQNGGLRLYQAVIEAANDFTSAIYINKENPNNAVYFSTFNALDHLESFIIFDSIIDNTKLTNNDNYTRLVGNTFNGGINTKKHIIINDITNSSAIDVKQNTFNFAHAGDYGLYINVKDAKENITFSLSGTDVKQSLHPKFRVGLDISEEQLTTHAYTFDIYSLTQDKFEIVYIEGTKTTSSHPNGADNDAIIKTK